MDVQSLLEQYKNDPNPELAQQIAELIPEDLPKSFITTATLAFTLGQLSQGTQAVECDLPEAEEKCVGLTERARSICPLNVDVYQTIGSLKLSQSLVDEARELLLYGLRLWMTTERMKDLLDPVDDEDDNQDNQMDQDNNYPAPMEEDHKMAEIPEYHSRLCYSKLLIEAQLLTEALAVLETMHLDDDEDIETWYLFGVCYFQMLDIDSGAAEDCKESLENCLALAARFVQMGMDVDLELVGHTKLILEQLQTLVAS